jgi:hypothetical protein
MGHLLDTEKLASVAPAVPDPNGRVRARDKAPIGG